MKDIKRRLYLYNILTMSQITVIVII